MNINYTKVKQLFLKDSDKVDLFLPAVCLPYLFYQSKVSLQK